MDITSTMKIISSKFLLRQAACLCDQIDCFTCVVTWYVVVQVLCSKMQGSLPNCSWTVVFFIVIILPLLQPMEKSLKEWTQKRRKPWRTSCSLAWPDRSLVAQGVLSLSAHTESDNVLCGREVWLVSHSQPLFPGCGPNGPQEKRLATRD